MRGWRRVLSKALAGLLEQLLPLSREPFPGHLRRVMRFNLLAGDDEGRHITEPITHLLPHPGLLPSTDPKRYLLGLPQDYAVLDAHMTRMSASSRWAWSSLWMLPVSVRISA